MAAGGVLAVVHHLYGKKKKERNRHMTLSSTRGGTGERIQSAPVAKPLKVLRFASLKAFLVRKETQQAETLLMRKKTQRIKTLLLRKRICSAYTCTVPARTSSWRGRGLRHPNRRRCSSPWLPSPWRPCPAGRAQHRDLRERSTACTRTAPRRVLPAQTLDSSLHVVCAHKRQSLVSCTRVGMYTTGKALCICKQRMLRVW